jgi:hypothetical protein
MVIRASGKMTTSRTGMADGSGAACVLLAARTSRSRKSGEDRSGIMEKQHHQTGATNVEYDLFSEIHSLLKGNSALEQYIQDAKGMGDKEVESCFQTLHDQNKQHVDKLRKLIEKRIVSKAA